MLVNETTEPMINMRGILACCGLASAREIAAVTASTPTRFSAEVARKAVGQSRGPKLAVTPTRRWTTPTVTTEQSRNWARLKPSLTDRCLRPMTSANPAPIRRATMYSAGVKKKIP